MKCSLYGCIFLVVLVFIGGCDNNEDASVKKKPTPATVAKATASPSAQDYNNSGTAYQSAGRLPEAVLAYQRAIKMKPTLVEAHHNLGTVYVMQGKLAEAITAYKRVIQLRPDMAEAYVDLGRVYGFAGRLDEAIAEYEKALARDATLPYAHYGIGVAYRHKGVFPEAIIALEEAIRLKQDFPVALMQLGYVYRETEQFREALEAFTAITHITPMSAAKAYHEIGVCHTKQGAYPEAIKAFQRALQLNPNAAETRNLLRVAEARVARQK